VQLEHPIQVVWLIDEPGTAQYAQTLAVVGEFAECKIREYFVAPDFEGQALHAGAFELYALPGSHVNLAHYQDWGSGEVYDISTRRVEIRRDAQVKWVPIHLGGHLTKQTLDIVTAEQGSDMRHTGMYFTERDEHLDLFTTDKHEEGHTTGDTVWKGALTGDSRASYEGLIHIVPGASETDTYLQTHQMLLSPKAKGDAIPSLIVEVDNVKASHGGTVGELDEEQIFYMMTRGLSRTEAVRVLVEGYFEEVVQRLEDPGLEALVRRRIAEKLRGAEDQVREFVAERADA
jgi:Fe-S cluster assembly protein SufD